MRVPWGDSAFGGVRLLRQRLDNSLKSRPDATLGLVRMALCGYLFVVRMGPEGRAFLKHLRHPPGILHAPLFDMVGLSYPPGPQTAALLASSLSVLAGLGMIGLCTRPALALLALCWLYTGSVSSGFGFFHHTPALAEQVLIALVVLPGTTALSFDRLLWRAIARRGSWREALVPSVPRFGVPLLAGAIGCVYAAAGISKLRFGAVAWLDGSTLAAHLRGIHTQLWYAPDGVVSDFKHGVEGYVYLGGGNVWAIWLSKSRIIMVIGSWAALLFELLGPILMLQGPAGRAAFIVAASLFHAGVSLLLGPAFVVWLVVLWALFPWAWAQERFAAWRISRGAASRG